MGTQSYFCLLFSVLGVTVSCSLIGCSSDRHRSRMVSVGQPSVRSPYDCTRAVQRPETIPNHPRNPRKTPKLC